jgi:PAS domain-containing protein
LEASQADGSAQGDVFSSIAEGGGSDAKAGTRGAMIVNAQSTVVAVNASALNILGYSQQELHNKSLKTILPPQIAGKG